MFWVGGNSLKGNRMAAKKRFIALFLCVFLFFPILGRGAERSEYEQYFAEFCAYFKIVPPNLARAVAMHESKMNPWAIYDNTTKKSYLFKTREEAQLYAENAFKEGRSLDHGLMQINSWWLRKFGISPGEALVPRFNVFLGVGILAHEIERYGLTWEAVAAYNVGNVSEKHGRAESYAQAVWRLYEKMK